VLVTPQQPRRRGISRRNLAAFRDLARARGLALVVDETYRDFDSRHSGAPHDLFADPDWDDTRDPALQLLQGLPADRPPGGRRRRRPRRLAEVEKFLDTVAICPGQLGQIGALWGMRNLRNGWRANVTRSSPAAAP
jgi:hypothetical protein